MSRTRTGELAAVFDEPDPRARRAVTGLGRPSGRRRPSLAAVLGDWLDAPTDAHTTRVLTAAAEAVRCDSVVYGKSEPVAGHLVRVASPALAVVYAGSLAAGAPRSLQVTFAVAAFVVTFAAIFRFDDTLARWRVEATDRALGTLPDDPAAAQIGAVALATALLAGTGRDAALSSFAWDCLGRADDLDGRSDRFLSDQVLDQRHLTGISARRYFDAFAHTIRAGVPLACIVALVEHQRGPNAGSTTAPDVVAGLVEDLPEILAGVDADPVVATAAICAFDVAFADAVALARLSR